MQKPDVEPAMFQSLDSLRFADSATTEQKTTEMAADESLEEPNSVEEPIFEEVVIRPKISQEQLSVGMKNEVEMSNTNQEVIASIDPKEGEEILENEKETSQESSSKASRPNSLDIQNVTSPVEGELAENLNNEATNQPSSPGHTPPPTAISRIPQENDTGMEHIIYEPNVIHLTCHTTSNKEIHAISHFSPSSQNIFS